MFTSCTNLICGKPNEKEKEFMDSLNIAYKDLFIGQPVPCYPGYYELRLKTDIDSTMLVYLDSIFKKKDITSFWFMIKMGN